MKTLSVLPVMVLLPLWAATAQAPAPAPHGKAAAIVGKIQRADYEGDRAALQRLYDELAPLMERKESASRIRYWRGFAMWRRAMNGFNDSVDPKELEQDMTHAVAEFKEAIALDPSFVDAKVAEASCTGTLMFLNQGNLARIKELVPQYRQLMSEAKAAAPDNPRLLWVDGANQFYQPPERGGSQTAALATYARGLELARAQNKIVRDPLEPSWGEPELLMNLAWSNLHKTAPDIPAAKQYAQDALQLVPYWHYVRDILVPQIQNAK
jgi:tetratricopeptide (TPR) repeat protein